jgi:uncharacterized protein
MQINVSQLLQEPIGATRDYQIDEAADTDSEKGGNIRGELRLLRTQRSILAQGKLSTEVELTCSRCLSQFRYPLKFKFEEEYLPTVDVNSGAPVSLPEDSAGAFTIDSHHILDVDDAVQQYTVMAIPMKPLCRKDCAGLCPSCGANLNQGPCACPAPDIDPRWAELKKLL